MVWVGRSVAAVGIVLIALPIAAGLLSLLGTDLPVFLAYSPTFVLLGIIVFVVGMAIRTLLGR